MVTLAPYASRFAPHGMVCTIDHLAAETGVQILRAGGTAADAAVAASAVLAVTSQHMCGMGGDAFALVHRRGDLAPVAMNASGRSGSGADPDRLRSEGHARMPAHGDIRSVPVPGCVDGWLLLHGRFGRLELSQVLGPARGYAIEGFPASPILVRASSAVRELPGGSDFAAAKAPGATVRRPGIARALDALIDGGRDAFYLGEFGEGLLSLGAGEYSRSDLAAPQADWTEPISIDAWQRRLWTVPPNSQGYLTLAGSWIADRLDLPEDTDDPAWAHLTVEAARQAAFDRVAALHEHASASDLLDEERLLVRFEAIDRERASTLGDRVTQGDTAYLCAVDDERMAVSLIQSNAAGFGIGIAEPSTGIFLHNRGTGFNLVPGHLAEYGPSRRPPHTLSPVLVTDRGGNLDLVVGTMGADTQPQVLLQLLARMLHSHQDAGYAMAAARWSLQNPGADAFSTWEAKGDVEVCVEPGAPQGWRRGLTQRGHSVVVGPANFGHAHTIICHSDQLEGASDPRALIGAAAGY
ncbi:MAG: gamma-glutamyltransferase family protein [Acidimicrobiales bacterium]